MTEAARQFEMVANDKTASDRARRRPSGPPAAT
jgi:hypothetical protein